MRHEASPHPEGGQRSYLQQVLVGRELGPQTALVKPFSGCFQTPLLGGTASLQLEGVQPHWSSLYQ